MPVRGARAFAGRHALLAAGLACVICAACAARHRIPLDCVPEQVQVYVDQELLERHPEALELRADRPHQLYFKAPGYEPQLVVLEPRVGPDGRTRLAPDRLCVELVPIGMDRRLTVEVDEEEARGVEAGGGGAPEP